MENLPRPFFFRYLIPLILAIILFNALIFGGLIPEVRDILIERKKEMIKQLTLATWSEIKHIHQQELAGLLTREEAQRRASEQIEFIRYGENNKDYFWISDFSPKMIMHPYRTDLNGQDLTNFMDRDGKRPFVLFAKVAEHQGEGYVSYVWQWKDDAQKLVPKLSFVKAFHPWQWIIGTGVYVEDVQAEISKISENLIVISIGISLLLAIVFFYFGRTGLISERARAQIYLELRHSEERYRKLVETSADGLIFMVEDFPVYANHTILKKLGYSHDEIRAVSRDKLFDVKSSILSPVSDVVRVVRKDGTTVDMIQGTTSVDILGQKGQLYTLTELSQNSPSNLTLNHLIMDLQGVIQQSHDAVKSLKKDIVAVRMDQAISAVVNMYRSEKIPEVILVADFSGNYIGLITRGDLLKRVFANNLETTVPVSKIMSAPLIQISENALAYEALQMMKMKMISHLVVHDERGIISGTLTLKDLLDAEKYPPVLLQERISKSANHDDLKEVFLTMNSFVGAMTENGVKIENITRFISTMSDLAITRFIAMAEEKIGPPPVPYSFVVFGSEARLEQGLLSDQDNGIVFCDVEKEHFETTRAYFLKIGEIVCKNLETIGKKGCPGLTMANNPKWCRSESEWSRLFAGAADMASTQELYDASIFLDMRAVSGNPQVVGRLKNILFKTIRGNDVYFFNLAKSILKTKPPIGFWGIQFERQEQGRRFINLKAASIAIVSLAKILALKHELHVGNTLLRLEELKNISAISLSAHDEMKKGFLLLMELELKKQIRSINMGREHSELLDFGELTEIEQTILKQILSDVSIFHSRVDNIFTQRG